jgi:hypothetical protein
MSQKSEGKQEVVEGNISGNTPLYPDFPDNAAKTGKCRGSKLPIMPVIGA